MCQDDVLRDRLASLEQQYLRTRRELLDLDRRRGQLQELLAQLTGAIQVLQELQGHRGKDGLEDPSVTEPSLTEPMGAVR
jgi:hypothetical protein